jgi:hypothetical protein
VRHIGRFALPNDPDDEIRGPWLSAARYSRWRSPARHPRRVNAGRLEDPLDDRARLSKDLGIGGSKVVNLESKRSSRLCDRF